MAAGDVTITTTVTGTTTAGVAMREYTATDTVALVVDIIDRTLTIPTSEVTVLAIGTVAGATLATWNCLTLVNNDSTNYVTVGLKDTSAKSTYFRINAGEMFTLMRDQFDADGSTGPAFSEFNSIDTVTLQANTAACVCQVIAY